MDMTAELKSGTHIECGDGSNISWSKANARDDYFCRLQEDADVIALLALIMHTTQSLKHIISYERKKS